MNQAFLKSQKSNVLQELYMDTNLFFTGMSFRLGKLMSAIKGGQK